MRSIHFAATAASFVVFAPLVAFVLLGIVRAAGVRLRERALGLLVGSVFVSGVVGSAIVVMSMVAGERETLIVDLGRWFSVGDQVFTWTLLVDRLSVPFMLFTSILCGTVAAFTSRYLHREPGHRRFMMLLLLFAGGMQIITTAGSLDVAFAGWEAVGLTSALLIAFFYERDKPIEHGLWAFAVYRVCDVGLLFGAVLLHHLAGSTEFYLLYGGLPWPSGAVTIGAGSATAVGFCLLFAVAGKSALVPFSGWLPRAMEGPTPSSAIFYGALSIHAGAYLLLRAGPLLDRAPAVAAGLVVVGLATAVHATLVGRAQTDIKSALAYASMTQVGLIVAEIGLGFRMFALAHVFGHACLRSLQYLRAPSLLHEHHHMEAAVGQHLARTGAHFERAVPTGLQRWLYRLALERGYHDAILRHHVVGPILGLLRALDRMERGWVQVLERGRRPAQSSPGVAHADE